MDDFPNISINWIKNFWERLLIMIKIGIVTIQSINYGNRLQNYALSKVLSNFGECETFYSDEEDTKFSRRVKKRLLILRNRTKFDSFMSFNNLIPYSNILYCKKNYQNLNKKYDFFIAGSDQIWNPNFNFISEREFLQFSEKKKNIAYAASLGVDKLNEEKAKQYRYYLENFNSISLREEKGAEVIGNLMNKKYPVVLDPTMLLSKKEWENVISNTSYMPKKKYIFMYILGQLPSNMYDAIKKYASDNSLEIFILKDIEDGDNRPIGPSEFIGLIKNSAIVCTDSFHASVFSILFHKPFGYFSRIVEKGLGDMSSRLVTLLEMFELQNHIVSDPNEISVIGEEYDYERVDQVLEYRKNESIEFLKQAIINDAEQEGK